MYTKTLLAVADREVQAKPQKRTHIPSDFRERRLVRPADPLVEQRPKFLCVLLVAHLHVAQPAQSDVRLAHPRLGGLAVAAKHQTPNTTRQKRRQKQANKISDTTEERAGAGGEPTRARSKWRRRN